MEVASATSQISSGGNSRRIFLQTIPHPLLLGLVDQIKEKGEEREVNVAFSSLCLQRFKFTTLPLGCNLENRVGMGWGHRAPKGPCSRQSSLFNLMRYRNWGRSANRPYPAISHPGSNSPIDCQLPGVTGAPSFTFALGPIICKSSADISVKIPRRSPLGARCNTDKYIKDIQKMMTFRIGF